MPGLVLSTVSGMTVYTLHNISGKRYEGSKAFRQLRKLSHLPLVTKVETGLGRNILSPMPTSQILWLVLCFSEVFQLPSPFSVIVWPRSCPAYPWGYWGYLPIGSKPHSTSQCSLCQGLSVGVWGPCSPGHRCWRHNLYSRAPSGSKRSLGLHGNLPTLPKDGPLGSRSALGLASSSSLSHIFHFHIVWVFPGSTFLLSLLHLNPFQIASDTLTGYLLTS